MENKEAKATYPKEFAKVVDYLNVVVQDMERILKKLNSDSHNKQEEAREEMINYGLDLKLELDQNYLATWLISTGGPAFRFRFILDRDLKIEKIIAEFQDWFIPWLQIPTTNKQDELIKQFAEHSLYWEAWDFEEVQI